MDQLTVKIIQKAKKSNKVGFQLTIEWIGKWLWLSWQSGPFWHQRSAAQIPTLEKFLYQLSLIAEQMKIKKQRPGNASLKKFDWS